MIEKEIVYLQKVNDTILKVNIPKINGDLHQLKILRHDSIFTYEENFGIRKPSFDWFDSIYNIKATFKEKHINIGTNGEYIQKIEIKDITHVNSTGFKSDYLLKKLTQRYQDFKVSGLSGSKHNLQFFHPKSICGPAYELNFYSDDLQIYDHIGYFLTIIYGCCTSTSEYKLLDLKGNYIFHSNDYINSVKTEYNHYLISALKSEVYDAPTIVIQDKHGEKQYVSISNFPHNMHYVENFYLKFKNNNIPQTGSFETSLKQYNLKNLDDLEIWIPFGKIDTLKIPFKNEKAFGVDYPQLKVTLTTTN